MIELAGLARKGVIILTSGELYSLNLLSAFVRRRCLPSAAIYNAIDGSHALACRFSECSSDWQSTRNTLF